MKRRDVLQRAAHVFHLGIMQMFFKRHTADFDLINNYFVARNWAQRLEASNATTREKKNKLAVPIIASSLPEKMRNFALNLDF